MNAKKQRIKAFVQALKQTYSYTSGKISVEIENDRVTIYSSKTSTDAFHDTDLIRLSDALSLSCYLSYNAKIDKVELNIF